jgi:Icc-related predicted phosphoesterase
VHIVATSDLHGTLPEIPPCDLLLIAGDVTPVWNHERNFQALWLRREFSNWLNSVPADEIVGVGGNHDFELAESPFLSYDLPWTYLDNEAVTVSGLKIWGSPLSPTFGNWAFMRDDRGLAEEWAKIPEDVDILMVHGPPFGHRDVTTFYTKYTKHVGSMSLANRLYYEDFPNLRLIICGHIHEGYGQETVELGDNCFTVANVALSDAKYNPTQVPMEFDW